MWELTLDSFRAENYSANIPTQDYISYETVFARPISDSNILATVEKAYGVDFLEEDCSTYTGFHDNSNR